MIDAEKAVEDPKDFFGQRAVVRRIFSRIGAARPQSVAVIGGIKTGKTSLLNCIAHERTRREQLDQFDFYLFCHVQAAQALAHDSESFVAGVQELLGDGASIAAPPPGTNHYSSLQKTVEKLHTQGRKLIFLFDDFHLITSNSNFPLEFFSFLRSLANNYNLAYVTTSFLELQKLCVIKDIEESPFFNIFTNLSLGPLSVEEGLELLQAVCGGQPEELKEIVNWCGSFPYILKLAARALFQEEERSSVVRQPVARQPGSLRQGDLAKTLLPVLAPYFEKILAIAPEEALNPLKSIARDKSPDPREAHVLRPLIKQGFLLETERGVVTFAPCFSEYLRKNLSKKLLRGVS